MNRTIPLNPRDIVKCPRLGKGDFKVIDKRNSSFNEEVRLQSLEDPNHVEWIYTAHCVVDTKQKIANAKARMANKFEEANKILNKPKRK